MRHSFAPRGPKARPGAITCLSFPCQTAKTAALVGEVRHRQKIARHVVRLIYNGAQRETTVCAADRNLRERARGEAICQGENWNHSKHRCGNDQSPYAKTDRDPNPSA